jgi:predicted nucleic acid-binding Zn ribbon protein
VKDVPIYLLYTAFAFLVIKAYCQVRYDSQRRTTTSMLLRWLFGLLVFSIMVPIVSTPNTEKEQRLKKIANITLMLFYLCAVLMMVFGYAIYGN